MAGAEVSVGRATKLQGGLDNSAKSFTGTICTISLPPGFYVRVVGSADYSISTILVLMHKLCICLPTLILENSLFFKAYCSCASGKTS